MMRSRFGETRAGTSTLVQWDKHRVARSRVHRQDISGVAGNVRLDKR
jgi:hypothetical protein